MCKFMPGDRVTRHKDVYDRSSPIMHGTVVKVYGRKFQSLCLGSWNDGELYEVKWDSGKIGHAYFPHGLDKEK